MLSIFPKEIDQLPRPAIEAPLKFIRKDDGDCDDRLFGLVMADFENKTIKIYSNDWCRQVGRYLVRRGLVTCHRIHIGGGLYMGQHYELTRKGDCYLDRRCILWFVWDEVKDFLARVVAHKIEP
jgi:hypothetical protein